MQKRASVVAILAGAAISALTAGQSHAIVGTWTNNSSTTPNTWNVAGNWNNGIPLSAGDTADLSKKDIDGTAISIDTAVKIGAMSIGDTSGGQSYSFTFGTSGSLTFNNGANPATLTQTRNANTLPAFTLESDLQITNSTTAGLTLGAISGGSSVSPKSITLTSSSSTGTLTLNAGNTFTGNLNLNGGTTLVNSDGAFGDTSANRTISITNNALLRLNPSSSITLGATRVLSINSGVGRLDVNSKTFTLGTAGQLTGGGTFSPFTLNTGASTVNINAANPGFNGSINLGTTSNMSGTITLKLGASGTIPNATTINIGQFGTFDVTAKASSTYTVPSGQTIKGVGSVLGTLAIGSGATISPGNSPGTLTTGNETWAPAGTYKWELNTVAGTSGADPGQDLINSVAGALTISATSGNRFIIDITSLTGANAAGSVSDFDKLSNYTWTLATFGGGISGFAANKFTLSTTNFANSITGSTSNGAFSIAQSGNNLLLNYTAAVDSTAPMLSLGSLAGGSTNLATGGFVDVSGSGDSYTSEIDPLTGNASVGSARVDNTIDSPVFVMLWLANGNATQYQALADALDSASGYDIAYVQGGGFNSSDPLFAEWSKLNSSYSGFNLLAKFDSGLAANDYVNWNFGTGNSFSSVTVDQIAVVPEPGTLGLAAVTLSGWLVRRKRARV